MGPMSYKVKVIAEILKGHTDNPHTGITKSITVIANETQLDQQRL